MSTRTPATATVATFAPLVDVRVDDQGRTKITFDWSSCFYELWAERQPEGSVEAEFTVENEKFLDDMSNRLDAWLKNMPTTFFHSPTPDVERDPENGSMTISAALNPPPRPVQEY
jgi:hypothetical protein